MDSFYLAFGLTLFAGLSTGIGSLIAFFTERTNTKFLSISLGLSAGVMIYVSMIEIFPKAQIELISLWGKKPGSWATVGSFFLGMAFIAIIDKLIPSFENPHEITKQEELNNKVSSREYQRLHKVGIFMALAIGIHNFPEGLATFVSALKDPLLGVSIAVAIAIHNIPEGISVSIPIYYATGSRKKALWYSFLSGTAEPIGALIGYFFFKQYLDGPLMGIVFAMVAGIMVFISLDELLPAAREYGEHHLSIYGMVVGMIIMALSLLAFL
jgi:ZIP family zinc transporter